MKLYRCVSLTKSHSRLVASMKVVWAYNERLFAAFETNVTRRMGGLT